MSILSVIKKNLSKSWDREKDIRKAGFPTESISPEMKNLLQFEREKGIQFAYDELWKSFSATSIISGLIDELSVSELHAFQIIMAEKQKEKQDMITNSLKQFSSEGFKSESI
jgi:hypothetical protein